jgi:glycosyltransferase involved in cell wall biosynthesis
MRILYLTNGFPYPLTSGYLRHYFLIRGLSQRHAVSLLSLVGRNFQSEHAEALAPFTSRILTFGKPGRRRSKLRKAVRVLRSFVPGGEIAVEQMRSAAKRCMLEERFDVVVVSGKRTFPAIVGLRDIPVVADMCDATSMGIRRRMRHCGLWRLPALCVEYLQVRAVEHRLLRHASHHVFASCRDRDDLVGPAEARTTIIPNGVDLDYWRRRSTERGRDTIVMTGAMDYAPNGDAAHYLIEEILPRVRRSVPRAKLFIVGRDAPTKLIEAGKRRGACVTGFVEDVRPYLEQASVFAAPLRFGAGIQNKLLEAMAMGIPVVASPLAADGLRTEEGDVPPLAVARTREECVELIVQQLVEAQREPAPDLEARRFVEKNFVWEKCTAKLEQVIASLIGRSSS